MLKAGKKVDATFVVAPRSLKNKESANPFRDKVDLWEEWGSVPTLRRMRKSGRVAEDIGTGLRFHDERLSEPPTGELSVVAAL